MSEKKKYYWLKLKDDFFDKDEVRIIEGQQNGKDYIIFYMKLLLKSVKTEGELFFKETIPYSPQMLSTITNTNIDTVKVAVDLFINLGLMERWDNGTLFMFETQNMIGSESKWAEYKRVEREKYKEIGQCPKLSKKSQIEIEKELEAEKYEKLNEYLLNSQILKDRQKNRDENLSQANRKNQIVEFTL
ncbi:phage replisome organizer N-terminal domain-containing protein [Aliarcobacter butzleri]|uniref:phage replisome organizer N-terminal domain-containing protein n=1 Tax=Aliarcobacter butzleri TaxID=28197 RepID=UPI0021B30A8C|nr:phage replisome organizer N-terminal domain-containing protein [Aliarcobacter butzleri]MCT7536975.1 phage replisome organizer N-terminal domain-containing protein [Aliarcobacter butzleri]MCT7623455.1 phage replisome organizer N-terminal domain-containing protein [Aliarcobacter butzleri]